MAAMGSYFGNKLGPDLSVANHRPSGMFLYKVFAHGILCQGIAGQVLAPRFC
jgi:hypothetical protein